MGGQSAGTAPPADERRTREARAWVEQTLGGRIVSWRPQQRWRPQYFIDVERPDGTVLPVLLRGWRVPGVVDTGANSRKRLEREAAVLEALERLAVRSPRYYGFEPEGGWILMEAVAGDDLLTALDDPARQTALFKDYMADFATIHAADPAALGLPASFAVPANAEANARASYRANRQNFRAAGCPAEPITTLGWEWLDAHAPAAPEKWSLCTGDVGANQFLFGPEGYRCLFDVEMAYIGDPLQDWGLMRYRNMCYPVAGFEAALRHWFQLSGRAFDVPSLHYWTMVGMMGAMPTFRALELSPDPAAPADMLLVWAMTARRRGLIECLQQIHGFASLPPGGLPQTDESDDPAVRQLAYLIAALDRRAADGDPGEAEQATIRIARANAAMALRRTVHGPAFAAADLADLSSLTGQSHASAEDARQCLAALIRQDFAQDLERRLAALARIEWRREYLHEPAMKAVGFASFTPLDLSCQTRSGASAFA